jgi:hypothetical protein
LKTVRRFLGLLRHETSFAEDRLAALLNGARLEGHLALRATLGTHCIVHLAGSAVCLARGAASLAALGSAEVLAGVEFLLTIGERECSAAIAASKLLISHKEK